jgi:hypothetical protein
VLRLNPRTLQIVAEVQGSPATQPFSLEVIPLGGPRPDGGPGGPDAAVRDDTSSGADAIVEQPDAATGALDRQGGVDRGTQQVVQSSGGCRVADERAPATLWAVVCALLMRSRPG